MLVLTYRDDEVTRDHPLQQVLGMTSAAPRLRRLQLARLSAEAVRQLGAATAMDADEVFAVTSGNPFFVSEVLASGDFGGVPPTIAEAVLARLSDLDAPTRDALEQLAVVPSAAERWLVEAVVPGGLAALAAAEQRRVLNVLPSRVAFRHELARRAIVDSMPAARRVACNQAVLAALLERRQSVNGAGDGGVDLSRIMHHAAEVGDVEVIVGHGPAAAREAVAAGSHREAVAHYRLVLDHRSAFPASEPADLLEAYAVECYTIGLADLAVPAQEDAVPLRRNLDDPGALGLSLRWLSRTYWWAGARPEAEARATEAIELLDDAGDRLALATALSNQSQLHMLAGRRPESIAVGERAIAMARDLGDPALLSHALNNVGYAYWDSGQAEGRALLEESLAVALNAHEVEHACRAYVNIVWHLIDELGLDEAGQILDEAIEMADDAEFLGFLRYMHVTKGMIKLAQGGWDEAEREAEWGVDAQPIIRCPGLVVLGRAQVGGARTAAPSCCRKPGRSPSGLARRSAWPGRVGAARGGVAGWRHVGGRCADGPRVRGRAALRQPPFAAELGYWMRLAGADVSVEPSDLPYALLAGGRWREAADAWQRAGCPYEHAAALAQSPDPADVLAALAALDELGAEPLARRVRHRLRELGVSRIPRGPTPSTRDNPAGLTDRQVEVVRLLADGLTNAEIAARLVLSVRTVDTHVAAILTKLDARTRRDAVTQAKTLGLVT